MCTHIIHILCVYMYKYMCVCVYMIHIQTHTDFTKYCGKPLTSKLFNFLFFKVISWVSLLPVIYKVPHDLTHPLTVPSMTSWIPPPPSCWIIVDLNVPKSHFLELFRISKSWGLIWQQGHPKSIKNWKWKWSHSVLSDSPIPWTIAPQAPLSMEFFRQEYWSGLPFPSPGDLLNPGIKPGSPMLQADALPSEPPWN